MIVLVSKAAEIEGLLGRERPQSGACNPLRIDHVGIAVRGIDAARGFYEALGMRVSAEETVEHERVRVAMLGLGEGRIELLEPMDEDSAIGRFLAKRGEGIHHIAVHCDEIDAKFEALQAMGTRLASDSVRVGAGGHRYFFVHPADTGGVLMEIVGDAAPGCPVQAGKQERE